MSFMDGYASDRDRAFWRWRELSARDPAFSTPLWVWLERHGCISDERKPMKAPECTGPLAVEPESNARAAAHLAAAGRAKRKVDELNELLRANDLARKQILALRQDEVLAYDREYEAGKALLVPARSYLPLTQGY